MQGHCQRACEKFRLAGPNRPAFLQGLQVFPGHVSIGEVHQTLVLKTDSGESLGELKKNWMPGYGLQKFSFVWSGMWPCMWIFQISNVQQGMRTDALRHTVSLGVSWNPVTLTTSPSPPPCSSYWLCHLVTPGCASPAAPSFAHIVQQSTVRKTSGSTPALPL